MSRSYKKHPWVQNKNKNMKKLANRRIRRSGKCQDRPPTEVGYYKKLHESCDISDYSFHYTWEKASHDWDNNIGNIRRYYKDKQDLYQWWKRYYHSK